MGEVRLTSAETERKTDRGTGTDPNGNGKTGGGRESGRENGKETGKETGRESGRGSARSRRSAGFAVWYLRAVTFVNLLSAVWLSLGQDLRRHSTADFYTPYLLHGGLRLRGLLAAAHGHHGPPQTRRVDLEPGPQRTAAAGVHHGRRRLLHPLLGR
ncbi:hypothetical protein [Streptomyces sp. NPDC059411]|uniref:hypothetical protein n=1 Tax=Streptomyces sp. NPDC059411 TaxID=3346825 RepID=UPI0036AFBCEA